MANKNFTVKNGLEVGGQEVISSSGVITSAALGGQVLGTSASPSFANITTAGYLRGPASFVIDPAAHGDDTGTVVIAGNLQVDGTQTTINSTTMTVDDLNLTLASGAANAAAANGAGINVDISGATNPSLVYGSSNDDWTFNKNLNVTGNIAVSGTVDGIDIAARDAVLTSTTTTAGAALPKAGGTMTGDLTVQTLVGINKAVNSAVGLSVGSDAASATSYGLEVTNNSANTRFLVDGLGSQRFYGSDNAETARFTDGKLGINEISPDYTLHVNSDTTNVVAKFESTDTAAGIMLLDSGGNVELTGVGNTFQVQPAGGTAAMTVSATQFTLAQDVDLVQSLSSAGGDYHVITHSGNESWSWGARSGSGSDDYLDVGISGGIKSMSWHEDGKVGIGNTAPKARVHIGSLTGGNGTAQEQLRLSGDFTATNSGALLRFTNQHDSGTNPNVGEYNLAGIKAFDYRSDWGGGIALQTAPNTAYGGTLTDRLVIDPEGRVGIGTSAPPAEGLTIRREGSGKQTLLQLDRPNTAGLQTNIKFSVADIMVGQIQHEYASSNYNHMSFTLRDPGGADVIPLWLQNSGNVGIGTQTPDYHLDVESTSHATIRIHAGTNSSASLRLKNDAQDWDVNTQTDDNFAVFNQTSSTQPFTIRPAGQVQTPLNPAFRARAKTGQVYASGWQKVLYDESVTTRGTGYASSRFTAPVDGWYQFNAQWTASNNADVDGTFSFWINGSASDLAASVSMPNTGANYDGHSISGCCYLAATHYVEAYRYSTVSTTTRTSNPYGGWFSGFLIG